MFSIYSDDFEIDARFKRKLRSVTTRFTWSAYAILRNETRQNQARYKKLKK